MNNFPPFPSVLGRPLTRQEIIEGLREIYLKMLFYEQMEDPGLVRYSDAEALLDYIEEHGLPPKNNEQKKVLFKGCFTISAEQLRECIIEAMSTQTLERIALDPNMPLLIRTRIQKELSKRKAN